MIPGLNLLLPGPSDVARQQKIVDFHGQTFQERIEAVVTDEAFLILMGVGGSLVAINLLTKR